MTLEIPSEVLARPDRKAVFEGIKGWMEEELNRSTIQAQDAIPSGSAVVDEALGGGYAPGKMTEIVEPGPSRGVDSLIHEAIRRFRKKQQFVALVDAYHQFDPGSAHNEDLRSLLWVRCNKASESLKACDILIRDGNFPLLILDMRPHFSTFLPRLAANSWYRLQRVSEQSRVAMVTFTDRSLIPCAHVRLSLSTAMSIKHLDHTDVPVLEKVECSVLKRRVFAESAENDTHAIAVGEN